MHTHLADHPETAKHGDLAAIIRACVHCGFCNATCPTYQLLGDELDGPRGRIYLIKQVLEGKPATRVTQTHLDRCLTCRACETTCPSGVQYGRLLDTGREIVDRQTARPLGARLLRRLILQICPNRRRFALLMKIAQRFRHNLPPLERHTWPAPRHTRKMLILPGCVQPSLAPAIDLAAARVLDRLGISLLRVDAGVCCGALPYHLSAPEQARTLAKRNIDACAPYFEQGIDTIVSTASGCGVMAKDYGRLLAGDSDYAARAACFAAAVKDIAEVLVDEDLSVFQADGRRIAFQAPCTLQHGQRLAGVPEAILRKLGYPLTPVADAHLCCGSAGVYSLLQPSLSGRLRAAKLQSLQAGQPDILATANIGCLLHLQAASAQKVVHWIELLE